MSSNTEILRKIYEHANRDDFDTVLTFMTPDIEWIYPDGLADYGIGTARGYEEVMGLLKLGQKLYSEMRRVPDEFVESDDRVVAFGHYHMRSAQSGAAGAVRFVHYCRLAGDKVSSIAVYYDSADIRRILEPSTAES